MERAPKYHKWSIYNEAQMQFNVDDVGVTFQLEFPRSTIFTSAYRGVGLNNLNHGVAWAGSPFQRLAEMITISTRNILSLPALRLSLVIYIAFQELGVMILEWMFQKSVARSPFLHTKLSWRYFQICGRRHCPSRWLSLVGLDFVSKYP